LAQRASETRGLAMAACPSNPHAPG
jgi:hypothetical protein